MPQAEATRPRLGEFHSHLGRRDSNASILSTTSSLSASSIATSENASCSGNSRKRQRECADVVNQLLGLAPVLRLRSQLDKYPPETHIETGPSMPTELEALKHRFLTHATLNHSPLGGSQPSARFNCAPSTDRGLAIGLGDSADEVGLSYTDGLLGKNTLQTQQHTAPNPVTATTHISGSRLQVRCDLG
jgi:hypothetical protein